MFTYNNNANICIARLEQNSSGALICASFIKQYNLEVAKGLWHSAAGKVTAISAESNSSLPLGYDLRHLQVDCQQTVINSGPAACIENKTTFISQSVTRRWFSSHT